MKYGLGVMIEMLAGNKESAKTFAGAIGKKIVELRLDDNKLIFVFKDGSSIFIQDLGQSCCEQRYMRTDDNLNDYIGAKLLGAGIKNAPNLPDTSGEHEIQFLEITTSKGSFTMSNHNEHNGYYGGFAIRVEEVI